MRHIISLKNKNEFDYVFNGKRSRANHYLVLYARKNQLQLNRIGISVSKKVGNSVVRHRVTRLIRESYRINENLIDVGYDIIVIARASAKGTLFKDIEKAFISLIKKIGISNSKIV